MNNQKPEGPVRSDVDALDLHSMFFTIQGEGPFAGHRALFIRLAGCNLQCPGCDTEYTKGRKLLTAGQIVDKAIYTLTSYDIWVPVLVVITGGEPLRQPIGELVSNLVYAGFTVQIESNGFFEPDDLLYALLLNRRDKVHLVVSPKTAKINVSTGRLAAAFKYVLDHESDADDGLPWLALGHPTAKSNAVARPPDGWEGPIYLSPYDSKDEARNKLNLEAVAKSCMAHGHILGVQLHKLIGLE